MKLMTQSCRDAVPGILDHSSAVGTGFNGFVVLNVSDKTERESRLEVSRSRSID
jgi:hypothetical protein